MPLNDRSPNGTEWLARDAAGAAMRLRARHAVATTDLFLPADGRLRDDDRATIRRLLAALVEGVERDLRRRLGATLGDRPMLSESLLSTRIPIAWPILERAAGLRDAELIAVLARRSEAARIGAALARARQRSAELEPEGVGRSPIEALARDDAPRIAAAAARLTEAEQARRDMAGGPILESAELPADVQHRLVWRIAAALRSYIVGSDAVAPADADPAIAAAAVAVLAGYDEGQTLPALALALARALSVAGRLDDGLIADALAAAHVGFAVAGLAVRAGIGWEIAWDMALDPDRLLPLCAAAGIISPVAAAIALQLASDEDDEALADRLDAYATLTPPRAAAEIGLWRLDPAYLDSIAALAAGPAR